MARKISSRAPERVTFWVDLVGCASLLFGAGCFNPSLPQDCTLPCESSCPAGMQCRGGMCVRDSSATICSDTRSGLGASPVRPDATVASGGDATGHTWSGPSAFGNGGGTVEVATASGQDGVGGGDAGRAGRSHSGRAGDAGRGNRWHRGGGDGGGSDGGGSDGGGGDGGGSDGGGGDACAGNGVGADAVCRPQGAASGGTSLDAGEDACDADCLDGTQAADSPAEVTARYSDVLIQPSVLPAPCSGQPYATTLWVEGGFAPYHWEVISASGGLALDEQGVLSGIASEAFELTVRVTDGNGRMGEASYAIAPRRACWLAYLSNESGAGRVVLYDPVLQQRLTLQDPVSDSAAVTDFEFSPDGLWLAYRLESGRLGLARTPTWKVQSFEFAEGALRYAWSAGSSILAVTFRDAGDMYLGGIRVPGASLPVQSRGESTTAADGGTGQSESAPEAATLLSAVPMQVDSDLTWFANDRFVAFHSAFAGVGSDHYAHVAELSADGFAADVTIEDYFFKSDANLIGGPEGFFAVDRAGAYFFELSGPSGFFAYYADGIIAPNAQYTAHAIDGVLSLFAKDGTMLAALSGCPSILAWAQGGERIACVANVNDAGEVRVFRASADLARGGSLAMAAVRGPYAYSPGGGLERPRAFSPSGRWFAFTTDNTLYIADLEGGAPSVVRAVESLGWPEQRIALGFSRDERWLVEHRGALVYLHSLARVSPKGFALSLTAKPPVACSEDYAASPADWCGSVNGFDQFAWSPDSSHVAFLNADGTLMIAGASSSNDRAVPISREGGCEGPCATKFSFQP